MYASKASLFTKGLEWRSPTFLASRAARTRPAATSAGGICPVPIRMAPATVPG